MAECETNLSDSMTFKDKKKFFEREIAQQSSIAPKDKGRFKQSMLIVFNNDYGDFKYVSLNYKMNESVLHNLSVFL